jgi:hypothetical protein
VKKPLIFLGFILLSVLIPNKVLAEGNGNLLITVDQTSSTVTIVDGIGRKSVMPARTALPNRKLHEGLYQIDGGLLPECIKGTDKQCLADSNGLYSPKEDQAISVLDGWNESNRAVALQTFFKAVKITKRFNSKMPIIKKGYILKPAFHSEILEKKLDGTFSTPPEKIIPGFETQGCIRLGYTDLRFLYTLILYHWGKGKIEIYVKG